MRRIPRAEAAIMQYSRKCASVGLPDMGGFEVPNNIDEIDYCVDEVDG